MSVGCVGRKECRLISVACGEMNKRIAALLRLLISIIIIGGVDGRGVLSIKLREFHNPSGRTFDGSCCDAGRRTDDVYKTCGDGCDYVMRLIVSGLGRANDHVFLFHRPLKYDSNDVIFPHHDYNMILTVLFDQWPIHDRVKMSAFFYDYDDLGHTTTLVDWFVVDLRNGTANTKGDPSRDDGGSRHTQTTMGKRRHGKTKLVFDWFVQCNTGSDCTQQPPAGLPTAPQTTPIYEKFEQIHMGKHPDYNRRTFQNSNFPSIKEIATVKARLPTQSLNNQRDWKEKVNNQSMIDTNKHTDRHLQLEVTRKDVTSTKLRIQNSQNDKRSTPFGTGHKYFTSRHFDEKANHDKESKKQPVSGTGMGDNPSFNKVVSAAGAATPPTGNLQRSSTNKGRPESKYTLGENRHTKHSGNVELEPNTKPNPLQYNNLDRLYTRINEEYTHQQTTGNPTASRNKGMGSQERPTEFVQSKNHFELNNRNSENAMEARASLNGGDDGRNKNHKKTTHNKQIPDLETPMPRDPYQDTTVGQKEYGQSRAHAVTSPVIIKKISDQLSIQTKHLIPTRYPLHRETKQRPYSTKRISPRNPKTHFECGTDKCSKKIRHQNHLLKSHRVSRPKQKLQTKERLLSDSSHGGHKNVKSGKTNQRIKHLYSPNKATTDTQKKYFKLNNTFQNGFAISMINSNKSESSKKKRLRKQFSKNEPANPPNGFDKKRTHRLHLESEDNRDGFEVDESHDSKLTLGNRLIPPPKTIVKHIRPEYQKDFASAEKKIHREEVEFGSKLEMSANNVSLSPGNVKIRRINMSNKATKPTNNLNSAATQTYEILKKLINPKKRNTTSNKLLVDTANKTPKSRSDRLTSKLRGKQRSKIYKNPATSNRTSNIKMLYKSMKKLKAVKFLTQAPVEWVVTGHPAFKKNQQHYFNVMLNKSRNYAITSTILPNREYLSKATQLPNRMTQIVGKGQTSDRSHAPKGKDTPNHYPKENVFISTTPTILSIISIPHYLFNKTMKTKRMMDKGREEKSTPASGDQYFHTGNQRDLDTKIKYSRLNATPKSLIIERVTSLYQNITDAQYKTKRKHGKDISAPRTRSFPYQNYTQNKSNASVKEAKLYLFGSRAKKEYLSRIINNEPKMRRSKHGNFRDFIMHTTSKILSENTVPATKPSNQSESQTISYAKGNKTDQINIDTATKSIYTNLRSKQYSTNHHSAELVNVDGSKTYPDVIYSTKYHETVRKTAKDIPILPNDNHIELTNITSTASRERNSNKPPPNSHNFHNSTYYNLMNADREKNVLAFAKHSSKFNKTDGNSKKVTPKSQTVDNIELDGVTNWPSRGRHSDQPVKSVVDIKHTIDHALHSSDITDSRIDAASTMSNSSETSDTRSLSHGMLMDNTSIHSIVKFPSKQNRVHRLNDANRTNIDHVKYDKSNDKSTSKQRSLDTEKPVNIIGIPTDSPKMEIVSVNLISAAAGRANPSKHETKLITKPLSDYKSKNYDKQLLTSNPQKDTQQDHVPSSKSFRGWILQHKHQSNSYETSTVAGKATQAKNNKNIFESENPSRHAESSIEPARVAFINSIGYVQPAKDEDTSPQPEHKYSNAVEIVDVLGKHQNDGQMIGNEADRVQIFKPIENKSNKTFSDVGQKHIILNILPTHSSAIKNKSLTRFVEMFNSSIVPTKGYYDITTKRHEQLKHELSEVNASNEVTNTTVSDYTVNVTLSEERMLNSSVANLLNSTHSFMSNVARKFQSFVDRINKAAALFADKNKVSNNYSFAAGAGVTKQETDKVTYLTFATKKKTFDSSTHSTSTEVVTQFHKNVSGVKISDPLTHLEPTRNQHQQGTSKSNSKFPTQSHIEIESDQIIARQNFNSTRILKHITQPDLTTVTRQSDKRYITPPKQHTSYNVENTVNEINNKGFPPMTLWKTSQMPGRKTYFYTSNVFPTFSHATFRAKTLPDEGFRLHTQIPFQKKPVSHIMKSQIILPDPKLKQSSKTHHVQNLLPAKVDIIKLRKFLFEIRHAPKVKVPAKGLFKEETTTAKPDVDESRTPSGESSRLAKSASNRRKTKANLHTVFARYWPALFGVAVGSIFLLSALVTSLVCRQRRLFIQRGRWSDSPQHLSEPPDTSDYATSSAASFHSDFARSSTHLV